MKWKTKICFLFFVLLCLLLSSCRTSQPIVVETTTITHDTIRVDRLKRDSIYMHDSVYVHAIGETIYTDRWHTKYIERIEWRDSVVVRIDTIPQLVTIEKKVPEPYTPWYMKAMAAIGILSIIAVGAWVFIKIKS